MKNQINLIPGIIVLLALVQSGCQSKNPGSTNEGSIDRFDLVNRHNVVLHEIDPLAVMSVGNGDFAFGADVTGMQSLEDFY